MSEEAVGDTDKSGDDVIGPAFVQPEGRRDPPFVAPKPVLVSNGFVDGRVYQTRDDPDRMKVPHTTPPFVALSQKQRIEAGRRQKEKRREAAAAAASTTEEGAAAVSPSIDPEDTVVDPEDPAARVTSEDLISLPNGFAKVLYNVLSTEECLELIAMGNEKRWSPALVNIGSAQQFLPEVRDHSRCIVDDEALTDELWSRIASHIPNRQQDRDVRGLNDRLRLLCYHRPGQAFQIHRDGNYTRPKPHPHAGDTSFVTVQLYLNEDFTGGATTFILGDKTIPYQPVSGSVLVFSQNLYHEGSALDTGLKYTLRTDVMYKPREATQKKSEEN